jgi:S-formylglutathione hydrolase FrmB
MLITMKHGSRALEMGKHVYVYIPEKKAPLGGFKTLYLLHGYFGDYTDWIYTSHLISYAEKYDLVIVMPDGGNSYYVNHPKGLLYHDYITIDLRVRIEETFHVSTKKQDRYIAGLSMGGFGALYLGLHHPELYSKIGALSPVVELEKMQDHFIKGERVYHFETLFGKETVKDSHLDLYHVLRNGTEQALWLSCGESDFLIEENRRFHQFLKDQKIAHMYHFKQGSHDWNYWDQEIQEVLKFMIE